MTAAPEPTSRHLALVGTTASGKSAVAFEIARRRPDVELVSVDSMCVYRGMDIGTAKPTSAHRAEVPHHLLDLADPSEDYSVSRFQATARAVLDGIEARGHRALLVGGTGLYLQAVVDELELPGQWPRSPPSWKPRRTARAGSALCTRAWLTSIPWRPVGCGRRTDGGSCGRWR